MEADMEPVIHFFRKLWLLVRRDKFNDDLTEEMAFHREEAARQLQTEGLDSGAAGLSAARQFGNSTQIKEQSHEIVAFWFETAARDFRYALRHLRKNPGFAATAVLVLSLGIGASAAIFAFVDAALIRPLPYHNPSRLADVTETVSVIPHANLSYQDYLDWKKLNSVFDSLDVSAGSAFLLDTPGGLEPVRGALVSAGFFHTLGVVPALGRDFYRGEDLPEAPDTLLLSYSCWQRRFGGKHEVIGRSVALNGKAYTIIGVLPQSFQFAPRGRAEFWVSLHATGGCFLKRSCHSLIGVGRLKDGVSMAAAAANMKSIAADLERQYPDTNLGQGALVQPLSEFIIGDNRPILLVLLAGAGLLLLIATLNVSSLLLVRSESRRREIAVRSALGASPIRIIRQFIADSMVLVGAGSALGLLLANWTMKLLVGMVPQRMLPGRPFIDGLGMNSHVVIFAVVVSALAAALFSLTPMARLQLGELRDGLTEGGRGFAGTLWRRFGSNLVVAELAVAMVLLVGAGLLGRSLQSLLKVELGFQPDHLATLTIAVPKTIYPDNDQAIALNRRIVSRISALPGVKSAALASQTPVSSNGNTTWIRIAGRPYDGRHNEVNQRDVSSEYFTTLRAKLLRGRYFTDAEDLSKPGVVVINQALARQYFPGENPVGLKLGDTDLSEKSIVEIVGVVEDIREGALDDKVVPTVYYPANQSPDSYLSIVVRTLQNEESMLPALRTAVHEVDRNLGIAFESTMSENIRSSPAAWMHRASAWLVSGFAAMALLLGAVGLYGVIAYSVGQRTREIGVRMALGAERSSVYRLIMKEAGWLTLIGIALGLIGAAPAGLLMKKLLFGVRTWDVPTILTVIATLSVAALLASFLPARRAASVNPVEALRAE